MSYMDTPIYLTLESSYPKPFGIFLKVDSIVINFSKSCFCKTLQTAINVNTFYFFFKLNKVFSCIFFHEPGTYCLTWILGGFLGPSWDLKIVYIY